MAWSAVWSCPLQPTQAQGLLSRIEGELDAHRTGNRDEDLAYGVDILARLIAGEISIVSDGATFVSLAKRPLREAAKEDPSIAKHAPIAGRAPDLEDVQKEISDRAAKDAENAVNDDDIPFYTGRNDSLVARHTLRQSSGLSRSARHDRARYRPCHEVRGHVVREQTARPTRCIRFRGELWNS